jgi:hypothetical protein
MLSAQVVDFPGRQDSGNSYARRSKVKIPRNTTTRSDAVFAKLLVQPYSRIKRAFAMQPIPTRFSPSAPWYELQPPLALRFLLDLVIVLKCRRQV